MDDQTVLHTPRSATVIVVNQSHLSGLDTSYGLVISRLELGRPGLAWPGLAGPSRAWLKQRVRAVPSRLRYNDALCYRQQNAALGMMTIALALFLAST